jgi:hypothetical protein
MQNLPVGIHEAVDSLLLQHGLTPELKTVVDFLNDIPSDPDDVHYWKLIASSMESETKAVKISLEQTKHQLKRLSQIVDDNLMKIDELVCNHPIAERKISMVAVKKIIDTTRKLIDSGP